MMKDELKTETESNASFIIYRSRMYHPFNRYDNRFNLW
jgi:hypothetical protein